jgi:hypothetical protein
MLSQLLFRNSRKIDNLVVGAASGLVIGGKTVDEKNKQRKERSILFLDIFGEGESQSWTSTLFIFIISILSEEIKSVTHPSVFRTSASLERTGSVFSGNLNHNTPDIQYATSQTTTMSFSSSFVNVNVPQERGIAVDLCPVCPMILAL